MRTEKLFAIWMTLAILLSTTFVVCHLTEKVHASGNNDFIQVEQKIWDVQTQDWVDESDVIVGSIVKFKCTITNIGSYYFSSVNITVTFPGIIDYYGSGVAPYYVSPDNKIIMINCPDQAACLYPGETWSFESLVGVVMVIGDGDNKMEITAIKDDGSDFYDFDTVTLHSAIIGKIVQVEQKIWDAETQQWVDEKDVTVGNTVTFKCTITNLGPYDFSSIILGVTFPSIVDYYSSGVVPSYVSPDKKTVTINVPSEAACFYSGGTWSFESLVGIVVASGDGDNKIEISPFTAEGYQFYDFDNVNLHSSDFSDPDTSGWIYGQVHESLGSENLKKLLPNALVKVINSNGQVIGSVYSGSGGYYEINPIESGIYTLETSKEGYNTSIMFKIIVNSGKGTRADINLEKSPYGWVYGYVLDDTYPVEGATVTIIPHGQSTMTNSSGYYEFYNLSADSYMLRAIKDSLVAMPKNPVTVISGQGTRYDLHIEAYTNYNCPECPEIYEIFIDEAIANGYVGSKINISELESNIFQHNISIYNGVEIKNLNIKKGSISFIVSGNETGGGKTIVINIDGSVFDLSSQILVNYDGESISMADDINDVLDPNDDGAHPEYLIVLGSNGAQLLVSVPHFSEHTIEFFVQQVAQYLAYAVIFAVVLVVIAAVVMFRKGKED